jgi:hypothetical protein
MRNRWSHIDQSASLRQFCVKFLDLPNAPDRNYCPKPCATNRSRGVLRRCSVGGANMKKKEDARLAVLREYDRWAKDHPNDAKKMGGFVFFGYLEKERPDLLDFRAVGSKWQTVHGWLRHGGRLKD